VIKYGVIGDPELVSPNLEAAPISQPARRLGPLCWRRLAGALPAAARPGWCGRMNREGGLGGRSSTTAHTLGHGVENPLRLCNVSCTAKRWPLGMLAAGDLAVAMGLWTDHDPGPQRAVIGQGGPAVQLHELDAGAMLANPESGQEGDRRPAALCAAHRMARW